MQRAKRANELVAWVNRILHTTDVRTLDDLKSGVHLIQIFHSIDPDSFDLARVDFRASNDYYYSRNLKLLQEVLKTQGLNINFHLEAVIQGEKRNDLYIFVSYIMLHYAALKDRANQKSALTYDPVVQRKRAQEKRNTKHRPFRVAVRHGMPPGGGAGAAGVDGDDEDGAASTSTGPRRPVLTSRSLRPFSDVATVVSDTSQAYTTVSTKQTSTRMKQRREELQKLAMNAAPQLRRMSSIGSALDRSGAHTPLRPTVGGASAGAAGNGAAPGGGTAGRSPLGGGGGGSSAMSSRMPTMASYRDPTSSIDQRPNHNHQPGGDGGRFRVAPVCTAINFEAVDLGPDGDLGCLNTWPTGDYIERDVIDAACFNGSSSQRVASPAGKSPRSPEGGGRSPSLKSGAAGKKASWSAFDAAVEEFRAVADSFLLPIERGDIAGVAEMQARKSSQEVAAAANDDGGDTDGDDDDADDDDTGGEYSNPATVVGHGNGGRMSA